jgi:hypothetical protein
LHSGFGKFFERQMEAIFERSHPSAGELNVRVLGRKINSGFSAHTCCARAARLSGCGDIAMLIETLAADFDWDRCLGRGRRQADWVACAIGWRINCWGWK